MGEKENKKNNIENNDDFLDEILSRLNVKENTFTAPALFLRGIVAFPSTNFTFDVGRERSLKALGRAKDFDDTLFLIAQKDETDEDPTPEQVYSYGVLVNINHVNAHENGVISVSVCCDCRGKIHSIHEENGVYICYADVVNDVESELLSEKMKNAYRDRLKQKCLEFNFYRSQMMSQVDMITPDDFVGDFAAMSYNIAMRLPLNVPLAQSLLESTSAEYRVELLLKFLYEENEKLSLEAQINSRVQDSIDKNNKDYFLHETINQIHKELGEDDLDSDVDEYRKKLRELDIDEKVKKKISKEISRIEQIPSGSPDNAVARGYVDKVLELPWNEKTEDNFDLKHVKKILDDDHYGLTEVKGSVLEVLTGYKYSETMGGQIICLVGPPGVGKTSIARSIARAMKRNFARVSLGGIRDEAEIRGHRKTYVGSMPGRIINAVIDAGTNNPVILLDEIDKLSNDYKGDPSAALLEVLDPEQNSTFTDHYIDLPFDLSNVLFITTANDRAAIPAPLLDRMEVIELGSYTVEEKLQIAKRHLLKKLFEQYKIDKSELKFSSNIIRHIIECYTCEAGVRQLERTLAKIIRKYLMERETGAEISPNLNVQKIEEYLGKAKYIHETTTGEGMVGVVNGLAWTSVGGEVLKVECTVFDGTGKVELTGSLGDVMKESAKIAISAVRGICDEYNIDKEFYKNKDIHIHFPEGATPKDGPSAGVAIVTSLVSALSKKKVDSTVAVTGETDINGNVFPIGGLKEKTMAAYRYNVKTCVIPEKNVIDLEKVDDEVKKKVDFKPVTNVRDALKVLLCP